VLPAEKKAVKDTIKPTITVTEALKVNQLNLTKPVQFNRSRKR
jgi:hypothetical protein